MAYNAFVHIFYCIFEHILGDFNLSLDHLYIVGGPKNTHIYACMHFMRKGAGASI